MCKITFPLIGLIVTMHAPFSLNSAQTVLYPTSRDTVYQLDTCRISSKGFSREQKRVAIELFRHDKEVSLIASSASRNFKYPWFVGPGIPPGTGYKIKIAGKGENPVACMSDEFTIKKPEIVIISPAAGTRWMLSDTLIAAVKWKFPCKQTAGFKISLLQNTSVKMRLTTKAIYGNSIVVRINQNSRIKSGDDYRIRITFMGDTGINAVSGPFSIQRSSYAFSKLEDIPLVWMPKDDALLSLRELKLPHDSRDKIARMDFIDKRNDTAMIGENIERAEKRVVTTNESVAAWCRDILISFLHEQRLTPDPIRNQQPAPPQNPLPDPLPDQLPDPLPGSSALVLKGEIFDFFVTENADYQAKITVGFSLTDLSGNLLWQGEKRSIGKNWGTSYKAENYYECIGSAYGDIIRQLFTDDDVVNILGNTGTSGSGSPGNSGE